MTTIDGNYSFRQPALSFAQQQAFHEFIATICGEDSENSPITLICGAGVSCDAGLPDWHDLVLSLCKLTLPRHLVDRVINDDADITRKADYALSFKQPHQSREELISAALYARSGNVALPGRFAFAIAQLKAALRDRLCLVTFNFDVLLENALYSYFERDQVVSFTLTEQEQWKATNTPGSELVGVLHVNGLLDSLARVDAPLILGEHDFQLYGPDIRRLVQECLNESVVLFTGLSMNDNNLVSPLVRSKGDRRKAYALVVREQGVEASGHLGLNIDLEDTYITHKMRHFQDALNVRLIVCKSYGQVTQFLQEVGLASMVPDRYVSDDSDTSLRYGFRFRRALDYAYSAVGLEDDDGGEGFAEGSAEVSERLQLGFDNGEWGLCPIVEEIRQSWTAPELTSMGLDRPYLEDEGFALFLWLRCRAGGRADQGDAPFALRLIGSSAYSHRKPWSNHPRVISIGPPDSKDYPASEAAYYGRVIFLPLLEEQRPNQVWRSMIALPITWTNPDNRHDIVSLGVLTLNSDRNGLSREVLKSLAGRENSYDRERLAPSMLGLLSGQELRRVIDKLGAVGTHMLDCRADS